MKNLFRTNHYIRITANFHPRDAYGDYQSRKEIHRFLFFPCHSAVKAAAFRLWQMHCERAKFRNSPVSITGISYSSIRPLAS